MRKRSEIAVIGLAGRFPGANNLETFWQDLKEGKERICFFSDNELRQEGVDVHLLQNDHYVKAKGALEDIELFDADFFGYPPAEAEKMDPQLRILHECAWEALENSGYVPGNPKETIGAYFGANENYRWLHHLSAYTDLSANDYGHFILNNRDYVATRISYNLNLTGPSVTLLTACSTSLVTIHFACEAIRRGECELAIAGGVSLSFPYRGGYLYQEGMLLSSDGHCRTFDARADGTVFGDGVGVVVLKALNRAIEDGDHISAVIKGSAVNNDGNDKVGFTAPSAQGQAKVIQAAHRAANVRPESISYVEAHGTGTRLGDPIEVAALTDAFGSDQKQFCALGSVKTNIGHLNIAAGVAAFVKVVLALQHRVIPPSLHFREANPTIDFQNSPFYVNAQARRWPAKGRPRRAGVSAFGFGGTNAHLILQEAPRPKARHEENGPRLLLLSARTESALRVQGERLASQLEQNSGTALRDVAYTLAVGRKAFQFRRFLSGVKANEVVARLRDPRIEPIRSRKKNRVVFMFPGQGAQYVGMAQELYRSYPVFSQNVDSCSEMLLDHLDLDIRNILYPTDTAEAKNSANLKQTFITQPTLFVISYALAQLWMSWGIKPDVMLGHSVGEFVAACLAGVFSLEDALCLVAKRGQLMQKLPKGKMLAVARSAAEVDRFLSSEISLAALNAPNLCVLAGSDNAIRELCRQLFVEEIPHQPMLTSHAFHSHMMEPILDEFVLLGKTIAPLQHPKVPMLSTVTGDWVQDGAISKPSYWADNVRFPVLFSSALEKIAYDEDVILLESGPGRTLNTLTKMHASQGIKCSVFSSISGKGTSGSDLETIMSTLGNLWALGVHVDWHKVYEHTDARRVPLPAYPFERQKYWLGVRETKNAVPSPQNTPPKNQNISQWFYVPSWKRTVAVDYDLKKALPRQNWLVLADHSALGRRLVNRLNQLGQDVVCVSNGGGFKQMDLNHWAIDPASLDDYELLADVLKKRDFFPQKILHLWHLSPASHAKSGAARIEEAQHLGFHCLIHLAQILGKENLPDDVVLAVVTNHLQQVTGEEELSPEKATVLGPLKVIPQEYPNITCLHIDIEYPARKSLPLGQLADRILAESLANFTEPSIAYRGGRRWVQRYEEVVLDEVPRRDSRIRRNGVYLITGGLGGIGLVLAGHLARAYKATTILTGRSVFPRREEWHAALQRDDVDERIKEKICQIEQLEQCGGTVYVITADVCDHDTMAAELAATIELTGPVHGVIHAAGLPGEGIIQLKSSEATEKIIAPKLTGTEVLQSILPFENLDFVILCSSVASILGGIGLVDYSSANAYLDAFAVAAQSRGKARVISVNWDMWGEVGMGLKTHMPDELKHWLEKELRDGITSKEGVEVFERILAGDDLSNVVVSTRDLQSRIDLWIRREFVKSKQTAIERTAARPRYVRPQLTKEFIAPESDLEMRVADMWGELFGIEKIGRFDNFFELGGHSLLAAALVSKLKKELDTSVSITDVMDFPTVSELSERLQEGMDVS